MTDRQGSLAVEAGSAQGAYSTGAYSTGAVSTGTYSNDGALPSLPVPTLEETCARYLASVRPLLDDRAFREAEVAVFELKAPGGVGEKAQAFLEQRAAETDNWLADWWDDAAYLSFPDPVMIGSNFGISCDARQPADDPAIRGAEVACRTLDFYQGLVTETIAPETVGRGKTPLDMSLFRKILASTRVPGRMRDEQVTYAPEIARHIVVSRKGRFFTLEVMNAGGRAVSVSELAASFREIIDTVDAEPGTVPPVAALTTERRPVWALERARMMADPVNKRSLEAIETAIFHVALDEDIADRFNETAHFALHGRPGQRWMDKVYSYAVDARGRVSQHGEHSPADGMQFVSIFDHACDPSQRGRFRAELAEARYQAKPPLTRLDWRLSAETLAAIDAAAARFEAHAGDLDIEVLRFEAFGKALIKTLGTGPDPVVQIAYQVAYQRLHARAPKTYESAQTRIYKRGRTETIRSVSNESRAFVLAFDDRSTEPAEKASLLRAAFEKHAALGGEAASGFGCDRHLLGLKLAAAELGLEAPTLFGQEIWGRGWELSTAQLPMSGLMVNGFGPVCPQGYGIGYVIQNDSITCNVSSWRSDPETTSAGLARAIAQALVEMKDLLLAHPAG